MSNLSAYRFSLIAVMSVAAWSGVMGHAAHAQSRLDLDVPVYGADAMAVEPIPAVPAIVMQQPPTDRPAVAASGPFASSSSGMLAALGDLFGRLSWATNEPMDAQAAMPPSDTSGRATPTEILPGQAPQIQIAQSQELAPRHRDLDESALVDPLDAGPAADNRRRRITELRPSSREIERAMPARYAAPDIAVPYGPSYRVDSGDRLRIVVFGQDGLTNTYQIGASGSITMPLIGNVPARGRTPAELAGAITSRLRDGFIRAPSVAVEIEAYRPFFILGEVAAPGQYPYVPNMSVESAIAIAGGFSPRAKRDSVTLTHAMRDGLMRATVPVGTPLSPGDTITVGERWF